MELVKQSKRKLLNSHQFFFFLSIISASLFGTVGFFGMSIIHKGIHIYEMLFYRFFLSSIFILLIYLLRSKSGPLLKQNSFLIFTVCGGLYALSTACCFHASESIGVGLSMSIFFVFPLFTIFIIWLTRKQKISTMVIVSAFTSVIGVLLISSYFKIESNEISGILYSLFAAFSFSLYLIKTKQLTNSTNIISTLFAMFSSCSIIFYFLSENYGGIHLLHSPDTWFYMVHLSLISTILPTLLLVLCIERIGSTKASITSVFEPIFAIIIGMVLLSEHVTMTQAVGLVMILFSSYIANKDNSLKDF